MFLNKNICYTSEGIKGVLKLKQELTRKQFDLLEAFAKKGKSLTQRELMACTGYSLGSVNRTVKELVSLGYAANGMITALGLEALEPYRAKRAVFIAAGFGSRLVPITFNTPKPLVRVHGKRIIDGLIDACLKAGINEIYIVRGYLSEQFDQLLYKYPMIRFLENPLYNEANNISSSLVARYLLSNAYVFEADLLIKNPDIITKYHYTSDFLAIKKTGRTTGASLLRMASLSRRKSAGLTAGRWSASPIGMKRTDTSCHRIFRTYTVLRAARNGIGNRSRLFSASRITPLRFANASTRISLRSIRSVN